MGISVLLARAPQRAADMGNEQTLLGDGDATTRYGHRRHLRRIHAGAWHPLEARRVRARDGHRTGQCCLPRGGCVRDVRQERALAKEQIELRWGTLYGQRLRPGGRLLRVCDSWDRHEGERECSKEAKRGHRRE